MITPAAPWSSWSHRGPPRRPWPPPRRLECAAATCGAEAFEDTALLLGCLRLADVLTTQGSALQTAVAASPGAQRSSETVCGAGLGGVSRLLSQSVAGILSPIEVLGLGSVRAPLMGYLPVRLRCVRGAPCEVPVTVPWTASGLPCHASGGRGCCYGACGRLHVRDRRLGSYSYECTYGRQWALWSPGHRALKQRVASEPC